MKIGYDAKRAYQNFTGLGNYSRDLIENVIQHAPKNQYVLFAPKDSESPRLHFLSEHENISSIFLFGNRKTLLETIETHFHCANVFPPPGGIAGN